MLPSLAPDNHHPYPFPLSTKNDSQSQEEYGNVRGSRPSYQASKLRSMMLEASRSPDLIVALPCSFDTLSSKFVEQAGFPAIFLSGFPVAASMGLPDTGYIAFQEMAQRIQETVRQVSVPVIADADTGYGGPMNVKRTIQGFALAGAAGVMLEDQTRPKRCGHTKGKAVVPEDEAYARVQAAVDARDEGVEIWILARTDSFIHGYEEALKRAKKFIEIGADCVFVEALSDRATMERFAHDLDFPCMANIIPGGRTENISAKDLAQMGFCTVAYAFTLISANIKAVREALEQLKGSLLTGTAPAVLSADEVTSAVGFPEYYRGEERYQYLSSKTGSNGHQWQLQALVFNKDYGLM